VIDDPPVPRGAHAAAGVVAHRVAIGEDGSQHPLPSSVAYCSLIWINDEWRVGAITFADLDAQPAAP